MPVKLADRDERIRKDLQDRKTIGLAAMDQLAVLGAVIIDVESTTTVRQAEVTVAKKMITRTAKTFGPAPERLVADTGHGSAAKLAAARSASIRSFAPAPVSATISARSSRLLAGVFPER
jgi:hypothetical protein